MFKRIFWFSAGAAAGIAGIRRIEREITERRARLEPDALANTAVEAASRGADRVRSALEDGRREMQRVARELEATHDPARRRSRTDSPTESEAAEGHLRSVGSPVSAPTR